LTVDIGGEDGDGTVGLSHRDLHPNNGFVSTGVGESEGHLDLILSATGLGNGSRLSTALRTGGSMLFVWLL